MKFIIVIFTLLLLSACTTTQVNEDNQGTANVVLKTILKEVEIRLVDDIFIPNTIVVNQGDKVTLQFMNDNSSVFAIPDYSIIERVKNNRVEFTADRKGVFEFLCVDCEESKPGVLKVI